MAQVRLYVDQPLAEGQSVHLPKDQAHYLFGVMRLSEGGVVHLFNGKEGEWEARVAKAGKKAGVLEVVRKTRALQMPPDLWLMFAPIKKARTDFIVEKAAEMGVAKICPVRTDYTNSERVRRDRLQAHAVEAAEQCGGTFVPEVEELVPLAEKLRDWPEDRAIVFCDEALHGRSSALMGSLAGAPAALLIGPEGGFSPQERERLHAHGQAQAVSLGPRILRADTAAVAALALWQVACGDWT